MAYDEGMAETIRTDLGDRPGLSEQKMFGGIGFMLNGNMVCAVGSHGAFYRPGKDAEAEALAIPGVAPMDMGGRRMGGFVRAGDDAFADDATRTRLTQMALRFAGSLPPKEGKT